MKKVWPALLVGILFFWTLGDMSMNSIWMSRWAALLVMLSLYLAYFVSRRIDPHLAAITFSTCFSGLVSAFWFSRYSGEPFELQAVLRQDSSRALIVFLTFLFCFFTFSRDNFVKLGRALGFCGFLTAIIILGSLPWWDASRQTMLFDNPSMAASFIVVCLFLLDAEVKHYWRKVRLGRAIFWGTGLIAILLTKTSTPLVALAVGGGAYLWAKPDWTRSAPHLVASLRWPLTMAAMVAPLFLGAVILSPQGLIDDNSRFGMWKWLFDFWWEGGVFVRWFGYGLGTVRTMLPIIQINTDPNGAWYLFAHNDWLQILFEQGQFGLASAFVGAYGLGRAALKKNPHLFAALAAYGSVMLFNFPLHWPVHSFLLFVLVGLTYKTSFELDDARGYCGYQ